MSPPGRWLQQPGPPRAERWLAGAGRARVLDFTLEPGLTLEEAIARPLAAAGLAGGTVDLGGGALLPFTYVRPALSDDPRFAAYYSASRAPGGETRLERAAATFGRRDGAPFVHCHGVWREADGARRGGHVLPRDTVVAAPVAARAVGVAEARFEALPDAETNFTLFAPVAVDRAGPAGEGASPAGEGRRALLLKVQPNEPIDGAIAAACRAHGLAAAWVRGVGSLVGIAFADGRFAPSVATEILVVEGSIRIDGAGGARVALDIAAVDVDGTVHEGLLAPGNPVCITFELTLEEIGPPRRP